MEVLLYVNTSDANTINKHITLLETVTGTIKSDCSVYNPVIVLASNTSVIAKANYIYIPEFKRYYFITDIIVETGSRYVIHASVDVLESFKTDILKLDVIIADAENTHGNNYLQSDVWVSNVKTKTDIINFTGGSSLLEEGEFILITAGG